MQVRTNKGEVRPNEIAISIMHMHEFGQSVRKPGCSDSVLH